MKERLIPRIESKKIAFVSGKIMKTDSFSAVFSGLRSRPSQKIRKDASQPPRQFQKEPAKKKSENQNKKLAFCLTRSIFLFFGREMLKI